MDLSFDIWNTKGDHIKVALSHYDLNTISVLSDNPLTLGLCFYDITLIRESGDDYVDYTMLSTVSNTLAKFLSENENTVLCFYCDANSEVKRSHTNISPQGYRSRLFSRMFEKYTTSHRAYGFVNHRVRIEVDDDLQHSQFAHFICRKEHENAVNEIGQTLMQK